MSTFWRLPVRKSESLFAPIRVSALSETTMKELRSALIVQLENPEDPSPELTNLLRRVGREAAEKEIRPEQLIIIFKQLWNRSEERRVGKECRDGARRSHDK